MKYLLVGIILLFAVPALADEGPDCRDLTGMWEGERFDTTLGAQRKTTASFSADGYVYFGYFYDDGNKQFTDRAYGNWSCDGDVLTLSLRSSPHAETWVDYFEIGELNTSYLAIRHVAAVCEDRFGDCGDINYELTKAPAPVMEHEGC